MIKSNDLFDLKNVKNVHFIGIGGSGMFPLAFILKKRGYNISGSDIYESDTLEKVENLGIKVYKEHKKSNVEGKDLIVFSAAIKEDNPEIIAAQKNEIPIIERSVMLGLIFNKYKNGVAVSGTHGKTTTTSMITSILLDSNKSPTAIIGATLKKISGNSCIGDSDIIVAEACEYVDSFLQLIPRISVITNIEEDHLDYFKNIDNIVKSFHEFSLKTSEIVVANGDNVNVRKAVENISSKVIFFGESKFNDYRISNLHFDNMQRSHFDIIKNGDIVADVHLNVPGFHNIYNATAAYIVCKILDVADDDIKKSLAEFSGAHRRFEVLYKSKDLTIVDDFAHHPTEISATLSTASKMGFKRIVAIFQPHTFSRTYKFKDEFARSLSIADEVIVSDILPVRETNVWGVKSTDITDRIKNSHYIPTFEQICEYVKNNIKSGDLVITFGGGNVYECANMLVRAFEDRLKQNFFNETYQKSRE